MRPDRERLLAVATHRGHTLTLASLLAACTHAPGTAPSDMGASEHAAAAEHEEGVAAEHGCTATGAVCWASGAERSSVHAREAERHRALAAKHRAASQALRDAEAQSCAGISAADRDVSPFMHVEDIAHVAPVQEHHASGSTTVTRVVGARVVFRAVPGMTAEWLQRLVDCHLARNAALGFEAAAKEAPTCPLAVAGARVEVESVGNGFEVVIRGDDEEAAQAILRRAQALRDSAPPSSPRPGALACSGTLHSE